MSIHNIKEKVENRRKTVEKSENISQPNKDFFEDFYNWLRTTGDRSHHRIHNYLFSLHKIIENHDFNIKPLDEDKI